MFGFKKLSSLLLHQTFSDFHISKRADCSVLGCDIMRCLKWMTTFYWNWNRVT